MILKIILCHMFLLSFVFAQNIEISDSTNSINILKYSKIYIDKNNKHEFDYIVKNNKTLFKDNKEEFLHLGYSEDAIWLKFSIKNTTNKEIKKVLEISNQMLDDVVLYTKSDEKYVKDTKGVIHSRTFDDNILKIYFKTKFLANEVKDYYLKVASLSCALYFDANLQNKDELYQNEIDNQLVLSAFFAAIVTLIIYNLFIFVFTKDLTYLYYSLYLVFTILEHLSYSSFALHIYSSEHFVLDSFLAIHYISLMSIFSILFVRKFLSIDKYKKIDFTLKIFLFSDVVFLFITTKDFYPLDMMVLIGMLSLLYLVFINIYFLYKGEKNAKYMIVGWSIAMVGWILQGGYDYGFWNIKETYPYFFEVSIFTEAILFSVALANKLNTTKELEHSVKTNKLLTNELHHRVKNNMQFIISMYRLKLSKYLDKNISNSLKEVEATIQAMSSTHEMLYSQNNITDIDTKEYISTLIDRLKQSYDTSKIDINLKIDTNLDIDKSIYVGIILNELITNSFKYAFKNNSGKIDISLIKQNNKHILKVSDDGIGFDTTKSYDSFGLELVKTLVNDELDGDLKIDANNKTSYIISF